LPHGSKRSPSRAPSASQVASTAMSKASSMSRSTIWANSRSRTSPGRCTPTNIRPAIAAGGQAAFSSDAPAAPVLALPDKPSIAVLPFANLSGDPEQEYLADGMVEEIITGLSRIKWLFVIARNSSFAYKGRAIDIRQVGRDLRKNQLNPGLRRGRLWQPPRCRIAALLARDYEPSCRRSSDDAAGSSWPSRDLLSDHCVGTTTILSDRSSFVTPLSCRGSGFVQTMNTCFVNAFAGLCSWFPGSRAGARAPE
jgi:hypothetical protein